MVDSLAADRKMRYIMIEDEIADAIPETLGTIAIYVVGQKEGSVESNIIAGRTTLIFIVFELVRSA